MFNSTFFKFLIVFIIIIGISFLVMGITADYESRDGVNNTAGVTIDE